MCTHRRWVWELRSGSPWVRLSDGGPLGPPPVWSWLVLGASGGRSHSLGVWVRLRPLYFRLPVMGTEAALA